MSSIRRMTSRLRRTKTSTIDGRLISEIEALMPTSNSNTPDMDQQRPNTADSGESTNSSLDQQQPSRRRFTSLRRTLRHLRSGRETASPETDTDLDALEQQLEDENMLQGGQRTSLASHSDSDTESVISIPGTSTYKIGPILSLRFKIARMRSKRAAKKRLAADAKLTQESGEPSESRRRFSFESTRSLLEAPTGRFDDFLNQPAPNWPLKDSDVPTRSPLRVAGQTVVRPSLSEYGVATPYSPSSHQSNSPSTASIGVGAAAESNMPESLRIHNPNVMKVTRTTIWPPTSTVPGSLRIQRAPTRPPTRRPSTSHSSSSTPPSISTIDSEDRRITGSILNRNGRPMRPFHVYERGRTVLEPMDSIVGPGQDDDADSIDSTRSLPDKQLKQELSDEEESELQNMPPGWDKAGKKPSSEDEKDPWAEWDADYPVGFSNTREAF